MQTGTILKPENKFKTDCIEEEQSDIDSDFSDSFSEKSFQSHEECKKKFRKLKTKMEKAHLTQLKILKSATEHEARIFVIESGKNITT